MNNRCYNWIKIGERIEAERKQLNLSAEDLANQIGTTRQTLRKWEKGEGVGIDLNTIIHLANTFNCEVGYLLGEYSCKTREITDIQNAIGLSEKACETLNANKQNKKITNFLSMLISSPGDLYFIASAYSELKKKKSLESAIKTGLINEEFINEAPEIKNDINYATFTLYNRFMLAVENSFHNSEVQDNGNNN